MYRLLCQWYERPLYLRYDIGMSPDRNIDQVLAAAYRMCDDVSDAIQPTHEVITASLVLPTSSGGVVLFPSVTTSTLPTTLVTDTGLPPPIATGTTTRPPPEDVSSTFVTSTRTSTRETTTTNVPPTDTKTTPPPGETSSAGDDDSVEEDEDDDDGGAPLNTPQIVGVSVGVAAAGAVAIVAIILARRCRRRNHPTIKTGFLPRRSTWGGAKLGKPRASTQFWVANQIRGPLDVDIMPPPPAYQKGGAAGQESWRPNGLGLSMGSPPTTKPESDIGRSPSPAAPPQDRRMSKLLPAMPEMSPIATAAIIRRPSTKPNEENQRPKLPEPSPSRASTMPRVNLFPQSEPRPTGNGPISVQNRPPPPVALTLKIPNQKDLTRAPGKGALPRDSNITQFEEDSILSPEGQIWRPPSSAPLTAMPYYVADGNGNWVLASPTKQWPTSNADTIGAALTTPDYTAAPSNMRGSGSNYSQGRASARASLAPAPRIVRTSDSGSTTLRNSTSVYSQTSSVPQPLFYYNPRQSSAPPHPALRPQISGRNTSDDSDTTVFDSSSSSNDPTPPEIRKTLTPVVESPFANNGTFAPGRGAGPDMSGQSGLGLSFFPQNYNPNNNRMNNRPNVAHQPPPTRPMVYYPPGQPSPTLGMMGPQQPPRAGGMSSANVPNRGRQPMGVPRIMGATNQPATMRIVEPSPEPEDPALAGRPTRDNMYQPEPASRPNILPVQPGPQPYRQTPPPTNNPQPQQRGPRPPYPYGLPPGPRSQPFRPQQQFQQPQRPQQPQQPPLLNTQLPTAIQRPATMDFQSPASERTVSSTASSLLAKRLGNDRAAQMAMPIDPAAASQKWRRDGLLSPEPVTPKMAAELPATPTWVPRLTPTRRGDDLFLNVQ